MGNVPSDWSNSVIEASHWLTPDPRSLYWPLPIRSNEKDPNFISAQNTLVALHFTRRVRRSKVLTFPPTVDIIPLLVRNTERWMDAIWRYLGHGKVFQAAAERCQMFWSLPIPINLIIKYILLHKTDDVCSQARMLSHLNGSFVWVMSLKNFLLHKSIQQRSYCGEPSDKQMETISRNYLPWWLSTKPRE